MKNVIKTIDLIEENFVLFSIGTTMRELDRLLKTATKSNAPSDDVKQIEFTYQIMAMRFADAMDHFYSEYKNNISAIRGDESGGLFIDISSDKTDCDCGECTDCDNEIIGVAELLKSNNIVTSDEFVDQLCDKMNNKSGGTA